jgi:ABC-type phosphate transport system permease subunit
VTTLPTHLLYLTNYSNFYNQTKPIQYGTVFVLMVVVTLLNLTAIIWRTRVRRKKAW